MNAAKAEAEAKTKAAVVKPGRVKTWLNSLKQSMSFWWKLANYLGKQAANKEKPVVQVPAPAPAAVPGLEDKSVFLAELEKARIAGDPEEGLKEIAAFMTAGGLNKQASETMLSRCQQRVGKLSSTFRPKHPA